MGGGGASAGVLAGAPPLAHANAGKASAATTMRGRQVNMASLLAGATESTDYCVRLALKNTCRITFNARISFVDERESY